MSCTLSVDLEWVHAHVFKSPFFWTNYYVACIALNHVSYLILISLGIKLVYVNVPNFYCSVGTKLITFKLCFQISGPLLDESQVRSIVDEIKQVITASSSRKGERAERAKAEDFDAEEGEMLREENEQEEELFNQVSFPKSDLLRLITTCISFFYW